MLLPNQIPSAFWLIDPQRKRAATQGCLMLAVLLTSAIPYLLYSNLEPGPAASAEAWGRYFSGLSTLELALFTTAFAMAAFWLNHAAAKTAHQKSNTRNSNTRNSNMGHSNMAWLPWASSALFGALLALLHGVAGVPVLFASLMMCPVVLLPPLAYRVMNEGVEEREPEPIFNMVDRCRIQDSAFTSPMIREFIKRYPQAKSYLYKTNLPHKAGGILLHSREKLPRVSQSYIEVTLDCPFTRKPGVFAEGKEALFAYLARHPKQGSVVSPLPQRHWDEWLKGLSENEWMERIETLCEMECTHEPLNGQPLHLIDHNLEVKWMPIDLTM